MEKRNVPAQDATTTPKAWSLTKSQWALYYWLLAHSKWNSFNNENHYYIYKNSFTNVKIMKETGIKSPQTMTAAFKKLIEIGAIEIASFHEGAYIINTTHLYVPMSVGVLRYLLAFNAYLDPALLITTFTILARLSILDRNKPVDFTKALLGKLLGLAKQHIDDSGLLLVLAVLEHSELIKLNKVSYINQLGRECIRYTLVKVDTEGRLIAGMLNDEEEIPESEVLSIWQKILTVEQ